nr:probable lipid-A-disaccharide synthase, mitochondrial [Tanacetum cinerariifolium]
MLLKIIQNQNRRNTFFLPAMRKYLSTSSQTVVDLASKDGEMRIFLVAGEVSGDIIGYRLIAALKKLSPYPIRFAGVGGSMMEKHGLKSLFPIEDIAVMGIWELLPHLNKFRARLKETVEAAILFRPHAVVTIDSKGFSFRLLKQLKARYGQQGPSAPLHFHYVAPSFWAWKGGEARLNGLSKFIDHVLCILPFEEEICRSHGGKVTTENVCKVHGNADVFRSTYGIPSGSTVFTLLPGSRLQEVNQDYIKRAVNEWHVPVVLVPGGSSRTKYDAFSASTVALCTSGTVAMELQLARLPCVVAYRAHFLTEWVIRYKAKIPYISLPNILLNSPLISEALFGECTPTRLASLLMELVHNEGIREGQIVAAEKVFKLLSPPARVGGPNLNHKESSLNKTPSSIAAWTVLHNRNMIMTTSRKMVFLCLLALLISVFLIQETEAAGRACDPTDPNCVISPSRKKPLVKEGTKADEEADRAKADDRPEIVIVGH